MLSYTYTMHASFLYIVSDVCVNSRWAPGQHGFLQSNQFITICIRNSAETQNWSSCCIYIKVQGECWGVILTLFSLCAAVPALEAGAGHWERVQFRSADLQQHQRAGQTLLAHLRLGSDQIPRVSSHDPQVALFSCYSSTVWVADTDN